MSLIPQAQIPTLSLLYATGRLRPVATSPLHAPSASLNSRIGLIRNDITKLSLQNGAIVNAANRRLLGGGGVDGAIHRAAGSDLVKECRTLGGCETGQAKITDAYRLPCKKVIHAVGPVYGASGEDSEALLTSCYRTSLRLAVEHNLDTVAFSAISTGIYGYPSQKAARTAIKTVREFLDTDAGKKLSLVVFVNFEMKDVNAYNEIIPEYFPPVDEEKKKSTEEEKGTSSEGTEPAKTPEPKGEP
ncbi:macro domain-containing protein [Ascodesmis nigricans]|uniref:Macro domain-containing protein n=1 Tax=Ascodesmis nigricans TaxID=341454 RepID=A0A4V3SJX7_9PEZI|nr:macro domain-containing protein [Ascodesmis nigricans]